MKKNRIFILAALVAAVMSFTGCGDLWKAAKEVTKNKWTMVTVQSTAVESTDSSSQKYNLNVYLYYTDEDSTEGNLSLGKGLNVLIEADAGNAKFFGDEISTASYAIKTFGPGESISNGDKKFTVSDDAWAAAYALGLVKSSDAPSSKSGNYDPLSEKLRADYWKEFMAEKIIDFLLGD